MFTIVENTTYVFVYFLDFDNLENIIVIIWLESQYNGRFDDFMIS